MKIINPDGKVFDAPTEQEKDEQYFGRFYPASGQSVECRCGWAGLRGHLEHEVDIEQMHPKNKDNPQCNMMDRRGCHWTAFEKCPHCKRCLFADGQFIGR